jgi:hypothetical protein
LATPPGRSPLLPVLPLLGVLPPPLNQFGEPLPLIALDEAFVIVSIIEWKNDIVNVAYLPSILGGSIREMVLLYYSKLSFIIVYV